MYFESGGVCDAGVFKVYQVTLHSSEAVFLSSPVELVSVGFI